MAGRKKLDSESSDELSSSDERLQRSDDVENRPPMSAVAAEAAAVRGERGRMRQRRPAPAPGLAPVWVQWRLDLAEALAAPAVAPVLAALGLPPLSGPFVDGRYALGMALGAHDGLLAALGAVRSDESIAHAMRLLSQTPAFFDSRSRGLPLGKGRRHKNKAEA